MASRRIELALPDSDFSENAQDLFRICSRAEFFKVLRLLSEPREARQEVQIAGGIGGGDGQQKHKLNGPGPTCAPRNPLRRPAKRKLQVSNATQSGMRESDSTLQCGIRQQLLIQCGVVEWEHLRHTPFLVQHLTKLADDARSISMLESRQNQRAARVISQSKDWRNPGWYFNGHEPVIKIID